MRPRIPPAFCGGCGAEFAWTERKRLAAIELFIDQLQDEDAQRQFRESFEQIPKDTPQAQVASTRIVRLLGQVKKEPGEVIRGTVVEVAGEVAKRILLGQ